MFGIGTIKTGLISDIIVHIPDITVLYGHQLYEKFDVQNMDSENWPYFGHQKVMPGIWTLKTGHIPNIKK